MGGLLRCAVCCMVCLAGRCNELCLLTLYELLFLTGTSVDLVTTEQRQDTEKVRPFLFVNHVCGRIWDLLLFALCYVVC